MKQAFLETLRTCPLFRKVSNDDLQIIADDYTSLTVSEKNIVIFSETQYEKALMILLKGRASVTKNGGSGKILMSILEKGDIFGMAALFYEDEPFLTEITALDKVTMLMISKENLKKIFVRWPVVSENYITILSEKIHFLNRKISTYTKGDTLRKVASFLLQYTDAGTKTATLPYSMTDMADALNTGRASVYRAFDSLENDGIIKRSGRSVAILDFAALQNI